LVKAIMHDSMKALVCIRAGKNLRFFRKKFRFLGFNVRTVEAVHWTQEYDQEDGLYTKIN